MMSAYIRVIFSTQSLLISLLISPKIYSMVVGFNCQLEIVLILLIEAEGPTHVDSPWVWVLVSLCMERERG